VYFYPYIDLAGYVLCEDNTYRFNLKSAREFYHCFFWLPEEINPLVKIPFGPITLNAPNDMTRYVLTGYGDDCLTHAVFQKHHNDAKEQKELQQKVRIVDFSPAIYTPNVNVFEFNRTVSNDYSKHYF